MDGKRERGSDETESSTRSDTTAATAFTAMTSPTGGQILPDLKPPDERKAEGYYKWLPSRPRLVGTTAGDERWVVLPEFVEEWRESLVRGLFAIGPHSIRDCWEAGLCGEVQDALSDLPWTSIDVFRMGMDSPDYKDKPVVIWVGVETSSIPWPTVAKALRACRGLLDARNMHDVECEIRVSQVQRLAGPPLVAPTPHFWLPEEYSLQSISTTIGQSFASAKQPDIQGTLGLYLWPRRAAVEDPPMWALTCRHVALPEKASAHPDNTLYCRRNTAQPALDMLIPGSKTITNALAELRLATDAIEDRIQRNEQHHDDGGNLQLYQDLLAKYSALKKTFSAFEPLEARVAGHVVLSPPISQGWAGPLPWTRDWCLVRMELEKFGGKYPRNVVDMRAHGVLISTAIQALNPHPENKFKFVYPSNGLFPLTGTIPIDEMTKPWMLDGNGHECILVCKHGSATGLTFGAASEVKSIVRANGDTNMEWAVAGLSTNDKRFVPAFSAAGDSGAVVFDIKGRVGGLLTGGATTGVGDHIRDVSYVTPAEWLLKDIEETLGQEVKLV
ncbi:Peptidase cysteine/serine, trypsin-like protein [Niveomyces insectorum RCEF 264]|uniref:Peptidase cysteine/serine, trypsin-like protein n=1 Tax=Niveomyces insectorum RCEF 264 TaxID=1081102 RepID=A0A167TG18_9HYPO|nr:Peptidase cysteine/serine, trypsin-like protein [Niveomyces insectorum RCEF 264]